MGMGAPRRRKAAAREDRAVAPSSSPDAGARPIAAAVLAALRGRGERRAHRLADLVEEFGEMEARARAAPKRGSGEDLHPAHAAFVSAQNLVSVLSEALTEMKEMEPFVDLIGAAEDDYSPGSPPWSPLTQSFFTGWAFFDARVGTGGETLGTTILEVAARVPMPHDFLRLLPAMQGSRMGLFVQEAAPGADRGFPVVDLRELWTGVPCRALVPAGYAGTPGELWYARVLPPPHGNGPPSVVMTTPYILRRPGAADWKACIRRALEGLPGGGDAAAYGEYMKFGPTPRYWCDFVFEAYAGHRKEAIFLEGLPDDPGSRPCSAVNDHGFRP